jgi:hypothetical protein
MTQRVATAARTLGARAVIAHEQAISVLELADSLATRVPAEAISLEDRAQLDKLPALRRQLQQALEETRRMTAEI